MHTRKKKVKAKQIIIHKNSNKNIKKINDKKKQKQKQNHRNRMNHKKSILYINKYKPIYRHKYTHKN